jgi:hypothetical protein
MDSTGNTSRNSKGAKCLKKSKTNKQG